MMTVKDAAEAAINDLPVKCVLATSRATFAMIGRPGIESMADVTAIAFHSDDEVPYLVDQYLHDMGLDPADIEYRFVGGPGLVATYMSGEVDAALLGVSTQPALAIGGEVIWTFSDEFPHFLINGMSTSDEMIANNPETVKGMVKAIYRAIVYLQNNKQEALDYAVNELGLTEEDALFMYEFAYEGKIIGPTRLDPPGLPKDSLNWTMDLVAEMNDEEPLPYEAWVDDTFLEQVKAELGID
jgi:ABC-type nitrate/sulfonate/bicarbonate transport system substrate-binding protein